MTLILGAMGVFSQGVLGVRKDEVTVEVLTAQRVVLEDAQGVARGVDQGAWSDVLGTIAGDDTILIICHDETKAGRIERRLKAIARL